MRVFSIGYEKRSMAEFCDALVKSGVRTLVDVRAAAWSQRPEFRKTALATHLRARGIDYVHCKRAGNPDRPKRGEPIDFNECMRKFSAHLDAHPEVVSEVESLTGGGDVALFCYEGHRHRCHRGVLIDRMEQRGSLDIVDL
jgi:uncharacterized protein (DUF488 family)